MTAALVCPVVTLPRSGLTVSRIGLGLAGIHLLRPAARAALIDAALDAGITHMDTAAFYGDGTSERVLGSALKGRRDTVTITTKFGLLPTPGISMLGPLAPLGRKARGALRRLGVIDYPRRSYSVETLRRSFAASLKAIGTDHVDILAIHEPDGTVGITDELVEALCAIRRQGAARTIGVAGDNVAAVMARWGEVFEVIQTAENGGQTGGLVPDFTYALFSVAQAPLTSDEADRRLRGALARRPAGAVVIQTSRPDRLRRYVEIACS